MNILYAEDDRDCRELFAYAFKKRGHKIYEARNGAQAVQIVRDEQLDLVILDIRMPMMTGYDAARVINQEHPTLPVLFFSAKGLPQEITQAFASSKMVIDYLVKPIMPKQLITWVENTIKECHIQGMATIRQENMARELVVAE
ncbi:response regulator [Anaerolineales bacterium HSG24]|nr:response regulator [Anaerolineales bacterium HSG24]